MNWAQHITGFNAGLDFNHPLPEGVRVMNPFRENPLAMEVSSLFYHKYFSDSKPRKLIMGINPGRHGAGVTGIPFTDTKRLEQYCGLRIPGLTTHEPSSAFIYAFIQAYGGVETFYRDYYITSVCPLGFIKVNDRGKEINCNYYDTPALEKAASPFILESVNRQLSFHADTRKCYCLGNHQNYHYLLKLNRDNHFFDGIVPLEHPRYIMQYRSKQIAFYIDRYLALLG